MRERWAEYVEELYNDNDRQDDGDGREINLELPILESEVVTALARMGKNKACGVDQIPTEFLKQMGENGTKCLTKICNSIYSEGNLPDDFKKSIYPKSRCLGVYPV